MIRVLIVTDVRLYGEGMGLLLERESGIEVAGTPGSAADALREVADLCPDLALVDSAMPNRIALIRGIRRAASAVKIVALGIPELDRDIISCVEAGISGYVTRDGSRADLVAVVQSVARGEALCSPRVVASLLERVAALARDRPSAPRDGLTRRELQVVRLIDEGLSNKEIAGRLCIEVPTVKSHVHSILGKLGVRRRGEAAARIRAAAM
jgi:two-component system, NarL family, nitrate/nitrite response regulator NarL